MKRNGKGKKTYYTLRLIFYYYLFDNFLSVDLLSIIF